MGTPQGWQGSIEMTARWLERLKPPETGRAEYGDKNASGLLLRVSHTGTMTWVVHYKFPGQPQQRVTIGRYPALTLAEAREKARSIRSDVAKGANPAEEKKAEKSAPTFKEVAERYIEEYAKKRKRSWAEDQQVLNRDFIPAWQGVKAKDIKRRDVKAVIEKIVQRGAPTQANRSLAIVRKLLNWAVNEELIEANPCVGMASPSVERQRDRVLTEEEIRKVWTAFNQLDPLMGSMFKLRLITAQRGGEVETMAWKDVDLQTGWWTIPAEFAKNGLSHRVPLSPMALDILESLNASTGNQQWVFPSPKSKGQPIRNVQKAAERVQDKSGVDFVMHDLRRTAASLMTGMGINRLVVSKILNHVEQGVTRVYDRHSYDLEKREALDAWAAKLTGIINKQPVTA